MQLTGRAPPPTRPLAPREWPCRRRWNERGADMGLTTYSCPLPLGSARAAAFLAAPALSSILLPLPVSVAGAEGGGEGGAGRSDPTAVTAAEVRRVLAQPYGHKVRGNPPCLPPPRCANAAPP